MKNALSDEELSRQILAVFMRNKVAANGVLRRIDFFAVRDGDFQRGMNAALANKWIKLHIRDRYRYILTNEGYAAYKVIADQ
jgi:hypothetical protein